MAYETMQYRLNPELKDEFFLACYCNSKIASKELKKFMAKYVQDNQTEVDKNRYRIAELKSNNWKTV